jgi:ketosteroid isomerase-like protein
VPERSSGETDYRVRVTSDAVSDVVVDRLAISDVLDDYAHGVDTKDWDLVMSAFAPDATLDYSAFGGPSGSRQEVVAWISSLVTTFPLTQHLITNRRIKVDGDTATCTAELFAPMGSDAGEGKMNMLFTGGRYVDAFTKTPDGWKISHRSCENAWLGKGPKVSGPTQPS